MTRGETWLALKDSSQSPPCLLALPMLYDESLVAQYYNHVGTSPHGSAIATSTDGDKNFTTENTACSVRC